MVFNTIAFGLEYGTPNWSITYNAYCQNNTSASNYGQCYNVWQKAIFVQSDTTTYPVGSLPCEQSGTCIRYTDNPYTRTIKTIFSYSGKQGILTYFWSRSHSPVNFRGNVLLNALIPIPGSPGIDPIYAWFLNAPNYEVSSWPVYDPVANFKAYANPYTIPSGYVNIIRWSGIFFTPVLNLLTGEGGKNNIWYAFDVRITWMYESSPLAIIPLDFNNDYAPYRELRNAFGYAYTGIDQPGWNVQDMISTLKDIFPNRAWAVFDDNQQILYLYNLTLDYVPDWLIERLAPVGIKVLQLPSDYSVAQTWLNEINARNQKVGMP